MSPRGSTLVRAGRPLAANGHDELARADVDARALSFFTDRHRRLDHGRFINTRGSPSVFAFVGACTSERHRWAPQHGRSERSCVASASSSRLSLASSSRARPALIHGSSAARLRGTMTSSSRACSTRAARTRGAGPLKVRLHSRSTGRRSRPRRSCGRRRSLGRERARASRSPKVSSSSMKERGSRRARSRAGPSCGAATCPRASMRS